jgi:hypothetical protein
MPPYTTHYCRVGCTVTIANGEEYGEEGEEGRLLVWDEPNWLVILAWVPPWKDPMAKI